MLCSTKTESVALSAQLESHGGKGVKYDAGKPKLSLISPAMWSVLLPEDTRTHVVEIVTSLARAAHSSSADEMRRCLFYTVRTIRGHIGPEHAIRFCCMGLEYGLEKYERNNWKQGFEWSRLLDAALRHIVFGVAMGEDIDKESGNPHWGHALCMLMFLLHCIEEYPELNDIY